MSVKEQLYNLCLAQINERIGNVQQAIREAQAASNDETKSSAGDKYETGRAMAHLEIEKNGAQLSEIIKLKQRLEGLTGRKTTGTIQPGSLARTSQGNFYIAIPAGQFEVEGKSYVAISVDSPIGTKLTGLSAGESFLFRDKIYNVDQVE